jgi:hypothetical protein
MPSQLNKIWIKIDGGIVDGGKIEIQHFSKILKGLQQIVSILQEIKYPSIKKEDFNLYMGASIINCYLVEIQPPSQVDLFTGSPIFNSIGINIESLAKSLNENENTFTETIEELFQENADRIRFLNNFLDVLSQRDYHVNVGFSPILPTSYFSLPPYHDAFIKKLIKKYTSQSTVEKIGIIFQQNGGHPRYFTIKTDNGEQIKCYYSPEMDSFVHELYKCPVLVKGINSKGIHKNEMTEISDFRPFQSKKENSIGEFKLKNPLSIDVSYDKFDGMWCLSNDEISVLGCGKNLKDAEESFAVSFEGLIIGILSFDDSELSPKSKEIKEKLKEFINIDDCLYLFDAE